ncbi:SgcJ/EcaC family oxidoreductase [Bradyrhizobium sp. TZ2]
MAVADDVVSPRVMLATLWRAASIAREAVMRSSPKVTGAALAMCIVLFSFASSALVDPKAEVAATTLAWGQALGEDDPEKVLPLYSDDAVLWGTLSPTVRSDRAALRDHFVAAFKVLPGLKVAFGDQLIRVYGNAAVNTGYYTFSYVKDGETKSLPARYSFTYVKNGDRWLIVDHHSSAMPSTQR